MPPLAGFIGKFALLREAVGSVAVHPVMPWVIGAALVGVVISFYYYFTVIREIFWAKAGLGGGSSLH